MVIDFRKRMQKPAAGTEVTSEWKGPRWMPQLKDFKDADARAVTESKHPMSYAEGPIQGALVEVEAWGRRQYAVVVDVSEAGDGSKKETFLMPDHATLLSRFARVKLNADVYVERGADVKTDNGTAFTYAVVCTSKADALPQARENAIKYEPKKRGKDSKKTEGAAPPDDAPPPEA